VKRGAALALAGCAIGLALFPLGGGLIRASLFRTSAYDPATLLAVPALLFAVAAAASYLSVRRAARGDPIVALRYE